MSTRYLLIILVFILPTLTLTAQNNNQQNRRGNVGNGGQPYGVISGMVHDETTSQQVEYANVILFSQKDSAMITGTITDGKGKFILNSINPGRYYLRVQFIGYENTDISNVVISPRSADVRYNDIKLKPKSSVLQGVEITSEKSLITNNLDKKVITVDKNMALGGGTASDVMENVPSVNVDVEGNISLRGSSNITLLIDGKPASQAGIASSDLLNQIPASSIESIEVITNPSVRYDPDGTTGIINIVLKKKTLQGFNGLASANIGTGEKYSGSLVLNYRHDKFNAFINYDARKFNMNRSSESIRTSGSDGMYSILDQSETGDMNRDNAQISGGFDYFIDTRNNITISASRRDMNFGMNNDLLTRSITNDTLNRLFNRSSNSNRDFMGYTYTLSYKHIFPEKGREFTNDIIFNDNQMNHNSYINQQAFDISTSLPAGDATRQWNESDHNNDVLTLQGNYVNPMANGSRLEAGYKADIRDILMSYDYKNMNPSDGEWQSIEELRNRYEYDEQIYAVYGIYANSYKKFKYQGGLRAEQVFTNSVIDQADTSFKTQYTSFYPSFHTQFDLGKQKELQLSYSRRVNRPSPRHMNPYVDFSDSLNLRTGNPELRPEFTNSIELGILQYWNTNSLTTSLFYRNTNDVVEDITTLVEGSEGITISKPVNINKETNYGLEVVGTANPVKWLRANGNVSFYRAIMSALPEYGIEGSERFSWSARLNLNFTVWKEGSFQLNGNYSSPRRTLQEYDEARYFADMSFRQDLMKKKLSLSLRLTDIFNTRVFNDIVYGEQFTITTNRKRESRVLYFGIQYQINNFNKKGNRENGERGDDVEGDMF